MKRVITILIAVMFATSMIAFAQLSSKEKAKKSSLSKSLGKVKDKRNQLRNQLSKKRNEAGDVMDQVHSVDDQMSAVEDKLEKTENELTLNKKEQQRLATDLRIQTEKLDQVKQKVGQRIRAIYVQGDASPLAVLSNSENLSDLASRKALLERIADHDRTIFNEVRVLRDSVLSKKKERDLKVIKIAELAKKHEEQLAELQTVRAKKKQIFSVLKAQEDELEDQLAVMEHESAKLEAAIAAIQAKSAGSVPIFSGRFIRPVSGRMSSGFGYRIHPISGTRKLHTGVDLASPSGTTIRAAGSGKVITASYIRGYGNTIVIDHGGGISTLYGHCSRLFASVGQSVKTGDKIAAVGSTGNSTGPHLHFEVRVNGKPVNPLGKF
ncbi:MAG: murein hydrolase activator EnvC family protein [Fimbriimonadaceae bacterium]